MRERKAGMADLILDSLEVQNFRPFKHLRIEKLGRVNLFVGKNNVGKSILLEAVWLYARQGSLSAIWELLEARNESNRRIRFERSNQDQVLAIKYLFYGRKDPKENTEPIKIGPVDSQRDTISVNLGWYTRQVNNENEIGTLRQLQFDQLDTVEEAFLYLSVYLGNRQRARYRLDARMRNEFIRPEEEKISSVFTSASGVDNNQISELWDKIALTNLEDDVLKALRIIAPEIERVNLISISSSARERVPIVKITDLDTPVPLRNLGEGINRLFGITLSLVNAKNGVLLIDEVESGLHYSVQLDLWRLIFQVAHRLNVQVFATTHSWDCVQAFQEAAEEDEHEEAMLFRLENKRGEIIVTPFDEADLRIVTREEIEVR